MSNIIKKRNLNSVKSISYGTALNHFLLWQKALLLIPLWGLAVVPVLGFIFRGFGNQAMQMGFGLVICLSAIYFFEDLLKRKIRLDDDFIFFGFRALPIKDVTGVSVNYKKSKFLPSTLVLNCDSGDSLKLSLGGLSADGVDTLIRHLQTRNSSLNTTPVISTLVKCRSVKRKHADTGTRLEIPYQTRRLIDDSIESFKLTALKWARVGPLLTSLICVSVWLSLLSSLYRSLHQSALSPDAAKQLYTEKFLSSFFSGVGTAIYHLLNPVGKSLDDLAHNGALTAVLAAGLMAFFAYLLRMLWRPNLLVCDKKGISMLMRMGALSLPLGGTSWSNIQTVILRDQGANQIRLQTKKGNKIDVDLTAIQPEDRTLLLKRLEKNLPHCQIDHALSQSMLAKSDHSYTELWLQSLNQPRERKAMEPLSPGQLIGVSRFEVLRSLGVGGQGTAYLCRHSDDDGSEVVLKETIVPVFADSTIQRRSLEKFEQEAKLLKSLNNEGVVKLLDYFVEDHRAYLVLEHIDGTNLRELVQRRGALDSQRAFDIALQMCDILKFLHANGVVHRDFTPDNLILNSKGKLKLIDFNVAQQIESGSTGTIVGKHAYLPPEQFRGKATTQSDLYAFGATLYYILTGVDPEPISQSSPAGHSPSVSKLLDQIVKRATALKTSDRFQTAEEIEADLLANDSEVNSPEAETSRTERKESNGARSNGEKDKGEKDKVHDDTADNDGFVIETKAMQDLEVSANG